MNQIKIRDSFRLFLAFLFSPIYLPHLIFTFICKRGGVILKDVNKKLDQLKIKIGPKLGLLYFLHNDAYFRSWFYYRIGPIPALLISWYRPGSKIFSISYRTEIGEGILFAHPYATILNAEKIGKNFKCIHCTTLGNGKGGRPIIGDNVTLGANVVIIGNVKIGDNVTIGAGSVVVKDIPSNTVAAGNPARVIKYKEDA